MDVDYQTASTQQIIDFCNNALANKRVVGGSKYGNVVVKLSDLAVVKYGLGVTAQEARAQSFAYDNLDHQIVHVPRVLRFFSVQNDRYSSVGYLVMEFVHGQSLESIDWAKSQHLVRNISMSLHHINMIIGSIAGPIGGGQAHGPLWSEYGSRSHFESKNDIQKWLNERLALDQQIVDLSTHQLRLCHLDVAPRNLLILPNDKICLLDWATAGFYPRLFEIWSLQLFRHIFGSSFFQALLQELGDPTAEDQAIIDKLHTVYSLNQRYTLCVTLINIIMTVY